MSSSTNSKCQICDKEEKSGKTRLYILVGPEHYDKTKSEFQQFLTRLRKEYRDDNNNESKPEPTTPTVPTPSPSPTSPPPRPALVDKYGIKKLYQDAYGSNFQTWYMDMDAPTKDPRFDNYKNANLKKESSDGSWSTDGMGGTGKGQVRLEGWSESGQKRFLNSEITVYAQYISDLTNSSTKPGSYAYQLYFRGGDHSTSTPCLGSCYKVRIRKDKSVAIVKEVQHPAYTGNRSGTRKLNQDIQGKWMGVKEVVYNFIENGKTVVKIELWVDENVTDNNTGNLQIKNNWQKVAETVDRGGWASSRMNGPSDCPSVQVDSKTPNKRQPDEILSLPGGREKGNLAAYRTDGVKTRIKYFSIREITPPTK